MILSNQMPLKFFFEMQMLLRLHVGPRPTSPLQKFAFTAPFLLAEEL